MFQPELNISRRRLKKTYTKFYDEWLFWVILLSNWLCFVLTLVGELLVQFILWDQSNAFEQYFSNEVWHDIYSPISAFSFLIASLIWYDWLILSNLNTVQYHSEFIYLNWNQIAVPLLHEMCVPISPYSKASNMFWLFLINHLN